MASTRTAASRASPCGRPPASRKSRTGKPRRASPGPAAGGPAPPASGAATSTTPRLTPPVGAQPPAQVTTRPSRVATSRATSRATTAVAVAMAVRSRASRGRWPPTAASRAATTIGAGIASAASAGAAAAPVTSALQGGQLVRVDGAVLLADLDGQGQEECGHRAGDHDVGERQRLHERVDHLVVGWGRRAEDRRRGALLVADREQQHEGAGLGDGQADDRVHQVPAARDAEPAQQEQRAGHGVGVAAHERSAPSVDTRIPCCRNWASRTTPPDPTATPTATFSSGTVPADTS